MTAVVHVGMSISEARERERLQQEADAAGASLAFLQHGDPSLVRELDRLAASGVRHVTLRAVVLTDRSPARSWLRRVAGHWMRAGQDRPTVIVDDREVLGTEAPLVSSAWDRVPRHHHQVMVCRGPRCSAQGADEVAAAFDDALGRAGLDDDDVLVTQTGCLFPCNHAPVVVIQPDDVWFGSVDEAQANDIVASQAAGAELPASGRLHRDGGPRCS